MFVNSRKHDYMLHGMPMDASMLIGMIAIGIGLGLVFVGLTPPASMKRQRSSRADTPTLQALDNGRLRPAHLELIAVLIFAIAIDTLKPFTFTFILPDVAAEYGLSSPGHSVTGAPPVAWLPFFGIAGTALGSLLWGYLGDRIGRRSSLLFAALVFVGTSTCATMPQFWENMVMCFIMGLGAGGLLPIAYTLLAETIPTRRRGQVVVLAAGLGTSVGFLLTSWLADWLMPTFGWRIMWFVGLPTGLVLIALSRYIPESPRFLLSNHRDAEAHAVMRMFDITVVDPGPTPPGQPTGAPDAPAAPNAAEANTRPPLRHLFRRPFVGLSLALVGCGLAWGFVNFGFLVWLPANVTKPGFSTEQVTTVLAKASLFSIPGALVVAWLYDKWSSKRTMVAAAAVMAVSLGAFAAGGTQLVNHSKTLIFLVVILLVSLWAVVSVLSPYAAEVYPTRLRAGGSGIVAGASKLGGVAALAMSVIGIAAPGLAPSALMCAIPMLAATLAVAWLAIETRGRRLEDITPVRSTTREEVSRV
jgi:putative MFS transporter